MDKTCTSIEQSQKLIELGIDVNSADMHYVRQKTDFMGKPVDSKWSEPKYGNTNSKHANYVVQNFSSYETLPAWSLSALLALTPVLDIDGEPVFFWLTTGLETWYAEYVNVAMFDASNPIDAVYEMACWLKENTKI